MEPKNKAGLTLEDVAILADGIGNIPDGTAERLRPLVREDERLAEDLAALRQLADDAGVQLLEDGLNTYERLGRLRERAWEKPSEVLDPLVEVPYRELIAMAGAMAKRADGGEKAELEELRERLIAAFGDELGGVKILKMVDELVEVEDAVAETVLGQLVGLYRLRRKNGAR